MTLKRMALAFWVCGATRSTRKAVESLARDMAATARTPAMYDACVKRTLAGTGDARGRKEQTDLVEQDHVVGGSGRRNSCPGLH